MLITQQGKILRMASSNIRSIGRATQGVRLIEIEGEDRAVSIAKLAEKDEERLDEKTEERPEETVEEPPDEKGEE
jgi:DNA gyrase subunit A